LTIRATDLPDLDVADVLAAYERRVAEACPEQLPLAMHVLERLPPARWTLEWHLPWWVGLALGLDPPIAREVVLSNLLGLGSIRLQDDLIDAEVAAEDVAAARILAAALYEAALLPYRGRFEPASPFWGHLDSCMQTWRRASRDEAHVLAGRGAPLRISAFAVCLLAGQPDAYPALERCLDHALEALVLYDHVADWEADLDAGRWNAFVAAVSSGSQVPGERDRNRSAAYVAMMTTDAIASYHARIESGLLRAAVAADSLDAPIPALAAHFRAFATGVTEHGAFMRGHFLELGDRAANLLLREPVDARS
jgi:hypothetical protein